MIFNVTLVDPANYKYAYLLTDMCRLLAYTLRSLGHSCDLTANNLAVGATNIIVGGHLLSREDANAIADSGTRYIAMQTEWLWPDPTGTRLISSFQGENFESASRRYFENASAVWDAYESNIAHLRRWNIAPEKLARIPSFGFHPELVDVRHRTWSEKDIDVLFLGSLTARRLAILQPLSNKLRTVAVLDAPAGVRNDLLGRAKLNLNIHADDGFRHLSLTRISYLLNNRCFVVSEQSDTNPELQQMLITADYTELIDACQESLADPRIEEKRDEAFRQYRLLPMTDLLRPLIV